MHGGSKKETTGSQRALCWLVLLLFSPSDVRSVKEPFLKIPAGEPIQIDEPVNPPAWRDSVQVLIDVAPNWTVRVSLKHDDRDLYLLFEGVEHRGKRLFPEIMIDPKRQRGDEWSSGQLWLHVSNNLCEGNGEFNVYERVSVFQCPHTKEGWDGTNPPRPQEAVRVRVSFAKMGLAQYRDKRIGLALDVTDATGGSDQVFRYWPPRADIKRPVSWATAVFE